MRIFFRMQNIQLLLRKLYCTMLVRDNLHEKFENYLMCSKDIQNIFKYN